MNAPCFDQSLKVSAAQRTEAGVKSCNEDSLGIYISEGSQLTSKGIAAVIADGVSAADAGKEAAEACVTGFLNDYFSTPDLWSVKQSAHKVLTALNRWLWGQSQRYVDQQKGYVCTLSALILKSQSAYIFHVGDSRIYRFRKGDLELLTEDHVARISSEKQYLARAMGIDLNLDIDFVHTDIEVGDLFIATTDGVHDWIPAKQFSSVISVFAKQQRCDLQTLADHLVDVAINNQSNDNLSCQVIRVESLGLQTNEDAINRLSEKAFPPELSPGMRIDGLSVIREIYASQRSQLYLVEDEQTKQRLVMKTPSRNYEDDPAYIERFIMEEWVGLRIDSPYVVKIKQGSQPRTFLYYLMEYIEGPTLGAYIKSQGKMDVREAVSIADKLVKGLRCFHRRETLHQDLKPDNIILRGAEPVIIDFGSVFIAGVDEIKSPIEHEIPLGTMEYSAPEYRLNRSRSERSDQFSLALILYEMLAGRHPYGNHYESAQNIQAVSKLSYVPVYRVNPHVPLWMDGALKKALQISSELRYDSLSEFIHDLSTPNPEYLKAEQRPLLEKDPLLFWKLVSGLLLVTQVVTLILWLT
ncbi:MAG: bifunctional protein-serine/threonine kinase/phosphatase [Pseudomonadales bacterium]|nr:bifunctional protein-serine/threonine kinase/phosphatase [Pseudomonadales bacterium]